MKQSEQASKLNEFKSPRVPGAYFLRKSPFEQRTMFVKIISNVNTEGRARLGGQRVGDSAKEVERRGRVTEKESWTQRE